MGQMHGMTLGAFGVTGQQRALTRPGGLQGSRIRIGDRPGRAVGAARDEGDTADPRREQGAA